MMRDGILRLLRDAGIRPSRRAGQHHVIDRSLLLRMANHALLSRDDVVLEVGAGVGNLTEILAERAGRVIAVERDRRFGKALREMERRHPNVSVVFCDVLMADLPDFNKVVSNIPYSISSEFTFMLLERKFDLAVLLYQEEFARRLVARPGSKDYGRLTVSVYRRAEVELLDEVPPESFYPPPRVSSRVVRLRLREPPFEVDDEKFSSMVRALFQHRNQRARNALFRSFHEVFPGVRLSREERRKRAEHILGEMADVRVFELSPEQFAEISKRITSP
ncbi:MAG: 16S rRNA (adenine(1518)-N(6)/adenine(1519)-N(6))-dimethyltransferase RsmA [Candidatus Hadarchaeales archaeon]